jgi:hypothetical protein
MAEIEPTQFAGFPYYDDYQDSKKFIKMLFKPGYALQARELTQLQTVLQKQISRFANHIFKDGSPVVDGQLGAVDCSFIRIETSITGTTADGTQGEVTVTPSQFVGKIIVNNVAAGSTVPQLRMKVLHAEASEAVSPTDPDPYHVLFVEYQNSATVIDPNTGENRNITTLKDLYEQITGAATTLSVVTVLDDTNQEVATDIRCQIKYSNESTDKVATFGKATLISNQDGIYYIDGAFIMASAQTIALKRKARLQSTVLGVPTESDAVETEWTTAPGDIPEIGGIGEGWTFVTGMESSLVGVRLFQFPSCRVGFTIKREVIDADADRTLLDPAYGSYNYAAPGADRYKVDLVLDQLAFTNQDTLADADQYKTINFVELTRVIDGTIRYSVKYPIYSELEETLARRTYDESGSYTVKPFEIDIEEYFNDEKVCVLRETVREIQGSPNSTPFSVRNESGTSEVSDGFQANLSIYGYRNNALAWKGIVSNADTFLSRHGEVDFRSGGYGTTLMHMIFGTPLEGDIMVSESYTKPNTNNKFFLKSEIPVTGDVFDLLYTKGDGVPRKVLSQEGEDPQDYLAVFPHVSAYSDGRFNGKYTLGRLHPEWASTVEDPESSEVISAIEDAKSKLVIGVGTGKAYIYGYEFENQNTKFIPIQKARESEAVVGEEVNLLLGNYVICEPPVTGDLSTPTSLRLPAWSSHPKVELWNQLSPDALTGNENGNTLVGTARIRGVTPTEGKVNVHLCDIQINDGHYFADFDHIRFRYQNVEDTVVTGDQMSGTVELFSISVTGGPSGFGGTTFTEVEQLDPATGQPVLIQYYDTILFSPKANLAIFDLPSLCSLKQITEFAKTKYDCKKTFSKQLISSGTGAGPTFQADSSLVWRQYGSGSNLIWILSNQTSGVGIVANTADASSDTLYTFKASSVANSAFQATINAALATSSTYFEADNLDKIMVFNANTNQLLSVGAISDANSPIKAVVNADKTVMYIVYAPTGGDTLGITTKPFQMETVVSAQTAGSANTTNFRKKTATVISEYTGEVWDKYFDEDGYFMVPLQNWEGIFQFNGDDSDDPWAVNFNPEGQNGWDLWAGDDDGSANNTNSFLSSALSDEFVTSLGFSDVLSVEEVLVWDATNSEENLTGKRDITKYFELINGTNDNFYDHAKIVIRKSTLQKLKTQYPDIFKNKGGELDYTLFVRFKFLKHSGAGPFTINSYEHNDHHPFFNRYEDIPLYTSPVYGYAFELRNCLDYRPSRENSTPARVAFALAESVDFTDTESNRPNALDEDCPLRDNSLVQESTGAFIARGARGDSETVLPVLGSSGSRPAVTYDYFTSRRDKLVLLKDREFKIISGKSAIRPESPKDVPESMSLYTLSLPQYTFGPEDVLVDYIDNRRFTMSDIAKLEKRIERVEYYTTLTLLEKEAAELSIPDPALGGAERIKNGIFVDNFKGHGVGDVFSPYYSCAMDFDKGHLRPRFDTRHIEFAPVPLSATNTDFKVSPDGVVTLWYDDASPNRYILQPVASRAISVNPFDIVSWLGSVSITPSSDTWIDTNTKPAVTINLEGENDAWQGMKNAFGTQWNDWETTWTGVRASTTESLGEKSSSQFLDAPHTRRAPDGVMRRRQQTTTTRTSLVTETVDRRQTREGIKTTITPQRITKELGDRIVDVSVVPYIRSKQITITGKSLKPNTILHAFFDNTSVDQYCLFGGQKVTPSNPIKTNNAGEVEVVFNLPGGVFKTGERQFRLTDSATNDLPRSNTSADASYFAQGMLQTKENTIVSTRVPVISRQTVTEDRVVRDVVTRVQTDSTSSITWRDPLAQTFLVDVAKNPKGVWVHSVDLFIKNAPSGESAPPIRVQIRPTVNGYPHSSMVLPFAEASLNANQVNLASGLGDGEIPSVDDDRTYTRFKFSTPVYLIPGEYAIVIMSNSAEYECYIAEMGEVAIGTEGTRITQQPYAGVFFKSQNASTWSADQNTDLMFAINTCKFVTSDNPLEVSFAPVQGQYGFENGEDPFEVDAMKVVAQLLKFDDSTVNAKLALTDSNGGVQEFDIPLNENFAPRPVAFQLDENSRLKLQFTNSDVNVSPCIDSERLSAILIDNIIGSPTPESNNWEVEYKARPPYDVDEVDSNGNLVYPVSRYISRRVDLLSGLECDDLKVYLSANLPNFTYVNGSSGQNTEIKTAIEVWAKVQTGDSDVPFDDLNWMRMDINPLQATQIATDEVTFTEYSFTIPEYFYPSPSAARTAYSKAEQQFAVPFTRYAIKIVMYSNNGTIVPKVKDLRVIAVV